GGDAAVGQHADRFRIGRVAAHEDRFGAHQVARGAALHIVAQLGGGGRHGSTPELVTRSPAVKDSNRRAAQASTSQTSTTPSPPAAAVSPSGAKATQRMVPICQS